MAIFRLTRGGLRKCVEDELGIDVVADLRAPLVASEDAAGIHCLRERQPQQAELFVQRRRRQLQRQVARPRRGLGGQCLSDGLLLGLAQRGQAALRVLQGGQLGLLGRGHRGLEAGAGGADGGGVSRDRTLLHRRLAHLSGDGGGGSVDDADRFESVRDRGGARGDGGIE